MPAIQPSTVCDPGLVVCRSEEEARLLGRDHGYVALMRRLTSLTACGIPV